jgi:hypothetical protein
VHRGRGWRLVQKVLLSLEQVLRVLRRGGHGVGGEVLRGELLRVLVRLRLRRGCRLRFRLRETENRLFLSRRRCLRPCRRSSRLVLGLLRTEQV